MEVEVSGLVKKFGVSKKGVNYVVLLVERPDGQSDDFVVFSKSLDGVKAKAVKKYRVRVNVQLGSEV